MNRGTSPVKIIILTLAIIGLLSIIGLGAWGVSKLAAKLPSVNPIRALASLISSITLKKEVIRPSLTVTAPRNAVESGAPVELTWQYDQFKTGGTYMLTYSCTAGVELMLAAKEPIGCGSPFNLLSRNTLTVAPMLKGNAPVDLAIEIGYVPQGKNDVSVKGSITLTITPASGPAEISNSNPQANKNSTTSTAKDAPSAAEIPGQPKAKVYILGTPATHANGAANLTIEIVDLGIINESTSIFQHATSVGQNMRAGVIFDIRNLGGVASQPWIFRALLPVANGNFRSDTQDPLAPGNRVRFTIGFKDLTNAGNNSVIITVDPDNQISDADRANNTASTTIYRSY